MRRSIQALAFTMVLAACGGGNLGDPEPSTTLRPQPGTTVSPVEPSPGPELPEPEVVAAAAVVDLSIHLGVPQDSIDVTSVERGAWRDGSIGCPEPGMAYTQALVPGTRVSLTHDASTYEYHQGGSQDVFYCESPDPNGFIAE